MGPSDQGQSIGFSRSQITRVKRTQWFGKSLIPRKEQSSELERCWLQTLQSSDVDIIITNTKHASQGGAPSECRVNRQLPFAALPTQQETLLE